METSNRPVRAIGLCPKIDSVTWILIERDRTDPEQPGFKIVSFDRFDVTNRRPESVLRDMDRNFKDSKVGSEIVSLPAGDKPPLMLITGSGQIIEPVALWLMKEGFQVHRMISRLAEYDERGDLFQPKISKDIVKSNKNFQSVFFPNASYTDFNRSAAAALASGKMEGTLPVITSEYRDAANGACNLIECIENHTPALMFRSSIVGVA